MSQHGLFWNLSDGHMGSPSTSQPSGDQLRIIELENQLEVLTMKCQAMWELLKHAGQLTDDHLLHQLQELDARDGKIDGKMSAGTSQCPQCQRKTSNRRPRCLYCGAEIQVNEVFSSTMPIRPPQRPANGPSTPDSEN